MSNDELDEQPAPGIIAHLKMLRLLLVVNDKRNVPTLLAVYSVYLAYDSCVSTAQGHIHSQHYGIITIQHSP